jgi:hypothetical protein
MEARRRSSRAVAEKQDSKDPKTSGGDGQGVTSSDDENEDNVIAPHPAQINSTSAWP